ncbi:MAG: hypothetical protein WAV21_00405 [Minisyncoccia bacterium]
MRIGFLFALLFLPTLTFAATAEPAQTFLVSEPENNVYAGGGDTLITTPVSGDLVAAGASVIVSSSVLEDATLAGGSIEVRKPVGGDLRVAGARIMVEDSVGGDLVAAGGTISVNASPSFVWIAGARVDLMNGSQGPVTVYGSTVSLKGVFNGDVRVVASDRISLAEGTLIHGTLRYEAPQQADIPTSAYADGGIVYTGTSYLPTIQEARTFAIAGAGVFFVVRILAALIAVGLLAGLFSSFAQAVADRALARSVTQFILLTLLGFAVMVATPALVLVLFASFAGFGVALLLGAVYVLLMMLGYLYAGVIAGNALARSLRKRSKLLWRDAVLGMLVLSLIGVIPVLGWITILILVAVAVGSIVSLSYRFAFSNEKEATDLL